ncbi:hypothetical protein BST61_g1032 [Cercospora zeina]
MLNRLAAGRCRHYRAFALGGSDITRTASAKLPLTEGTRPLHAKLVGSTEPELREERFSFRISVQSQDKSVP